MANFRMSAFGFSGPGLSGGFNLGSSHGRTYFSGGMQGFVGGNHVSAGVRSNGHDVRGWGGGYGAGYGGYGGNYGGRFGGGYARSEFMQFQGGYHQRGFGGPIYSHGFDPYNRGYVQGGYYDQRGRMGDYGARITGGGFVGDRRGGVGIGVDPAGGIHVGGGTRGGYGRSSGFSVSIPPQAFRREPDYAREEQFRREQGGRPDPRDIWDGRNYPSRPAAATAGAASAAPNSPPAFEQVQDGFFRRGQSEQLWAQTNFKLAEGVTSANATSLYGQDRQIDLKQWEGAPVMITGLTDGKGETRYNIQNLRTREETIVPGTAIDASLKDAAQRAYHVQHGTLPPPPPPPTPEEEARAAREMNERTAAENGGPAPSRPSAAPASTAPASAAPAAATTPPAAPKGYSDAARQGMDGLVDRAVSQPAPAQPAATKSGFDISSLKTGQPLTDVELNKMSRDGIQLTKVGQESDTRVFMKDGQVLGGYNAGNGPTSFVARADLDTHLAKTGSSQTIASIESTSLRANDAVAAALQQKADIAAAPAPTAAAPASPKMAVGGEFA